MDKAKAYVESKGCRFISATTENKNIKLNIISTCGHESIVFYSNFRVKGTGIICSSCSLEKARHKVMTHHNTSSLEIEKQGIDMIREALDDLFCVEVTREGCLADIIIKAKQNDDDIWYGIQLKTTKQINDVNQYAFGFRHRSLYPNCIILLNVLSEKRIWCLPKDFDIPKSRINIGSTDRGKYASFEIHTCSLASHLKSIITQYKPSSYKEWNFCTEQTALEDYFSGIRKDKLNFLDCTRPTHNQLCYDFTINGYRVQEKSISLEERKTKSKTFTLKRNNGTKRNDQNKLVRQFRPYNIGDNDFYWLWCKDTDLFYIIPEHVLVEQNIIGPNGKGRFTIPKKGVLPWIQPYTFDINNIDEQKIKSFFNLV